MVAVVDASDVIYADYPPDPQAIEGWTKPQKILVILAHPDDPEFFMGATLKRWALLGHEIHYCLLTTGQKGSQDAQISAAALSQIRISEQQEAARKLGVRSVQFLDYIDGEVVPDLEMRKKLIRIMRQIRPEVVVSSDPLNYFPAGSNRVNHPDHRAAGQVVLDALFPGAGNPRFFPELISEEGLQPVGIREFWFSIPSEANLVIDVSAYYQMKLDAIVCHHSQIGPNEDEFRRMISDHWAVMDEKGKPSYHERFRRIIFN